MRIEHVAVNVRDLESTKDFFVKYFGGKANEGYHNPNTGLSTYFIEFPDGGSRLELMNWQNTMMDADGLVRDWLGRSGQPKHPLGYCHIAMSVGSREVVDEMTERLIADGFHCISGPRTTGDGCYESCFLLSDGEELEITI